MICPSSEQDRDSMSEPEELASLREMAGELQQQNLRSKAVLLERLRQHIDRASALGHRHARIHEILVDAGIAMSFDVYETTLRRVRKRAAQSGLHKPEEEQGGKVDERNRVSGAGSGFDKPDERGLSKPENPGSVEPEGSAHQEGKDTGLQEPSGEPLSGLDPVFGVRNALADADKAVEELAQRRARGRFKRG